MNDPFAELLAAPGVVEHCELRGTFGFMAYHGGALEEMTDVIAARAAMHSAASYYAVLQPPHLNMHVPSHRVDPRSSAHLQRFVAHVDTVVTLHGFGRRPLADAVLLGGQNRALADHIADHLRQHLPGYRMITDLDAIPKELRGLHRANPVNLPANRGVQIELPHRARSSAVAELAAGLAAAARAWLRERAAPPPNRRTDAGSAADRAAGSAAPARTRS